MIDQLELTATTGEDGDVVSVGIPPHVMRRISRMEPSARAELERRIALAIEQAYEAIAAVRSLTSDQLVTRLAIARCDAEIFSEEIDRRATASPGDEPAPVEPVHA